MIPPSVPIETETVFEWLRRYESRNVTFLAPDGSWPIVWTRAKGVHVWDTEGRRYLDMTAAFGVAAAGHGNPRVVHAAHTQLDTLVHAMGDVHPHAGKAALVRELSRLTFERWSRSSPGPDRRHATHGRTILCNSGFEAVEAALKTALLVTGKRGVLAFDGAYHGLGYGALNVTNRKHFRSPFESQLGRFGVFVPFPSTGLEPFDSERNSVPDSPNNRREKKAGQGRKGFAQHVNTLLRGGAIGAVLIEPVQARGGTRVADPAMLRYLRRACDRWGALLILDEIYTGFGRTGKWFACEHAGVIPDLVCLGKALTGGFPLSACVGRADLMDRAWPESTGEAIHTSTFLGHPVGCAMALANLREIRSRNLPRRSARLGRFLLDGLERVAARCSGFRATARGLGLMAGLELRRRDGQPATEETFELIRSLLRRGILALPEGEHGNVIGITPPLVVSERDLARLIRALEAGLAGGLK